MTCSRIVPHQWHQCWFPGQTVFKTGLEPNSCFCQMGAHNIGSMPALLLQQFSVRPQNDRSYLTPDREGSQPAQILLDPFSNFWVNHNKLNTPMHHFYPALEASQPADQRLSAWYCCWTCMDTPVHQAFLLCGTCGFTSCFLECHRPKGVADRNTAIKNNTQQEFQWVWDGRTIFPGWMYFVVVHA